MLRNHKLNIRRFRSLTAGMALPAIVLLLGNAQRADATNVPLTPTVSVTSGPSPSNNVPVGDTSTTNLNIDVTSPTPLDPEATLNGPTYSYSTQVFERADTSAAWSSAPGSDYDGGSVAQSDNSSPAGTLTFKPKNAAYYKVVVTGTATYGDSTKQNNYSGSGSTNVMVTGVGVKTVQITPQGGGSPHTAGGGNYVQLGKGVTLTATAAPAGASFPAGYPTWTTDETSTPFGAGSATISYSSKVLGSHWTQAKCGTATVTSSLFVIDLQISMDQPNILSGCTNYSPKSDINFTVSATLQPGDTLDTATWSTSGGAAPSGTSTSGSTYTAHFNSDGSVTVTYADASNTKHVPIVQPSVSINNVAANSGTAIQSDTIGNTTLSLGSQVNGFAATTWNLPIWTYTYVQGSHTGTASTKCATNSQINSSVTVSEPPDTVSQETCNILLQVSDYCGNTASATPVSIVVHHQVTLEPIADTFINYEPTAGGARVSAAIPGGATGVTTTYSESSADTHTYTYTESSGVSADLSPAIKAQYGISIGSSVSSTGQASLSVSTSVPAGSYGWWFRRTEHDQYTANVFVWSADGTKKNPGTATIDHWLWAPKLLLTASSTPIPTSAAPW